MLKWKILAVVGVTVGVLGSGWGLAAQRADSRVFELRMYKAMPGKRDVLSARFRDHTAAMFEQAGITNVGYWTAATGDDIDDIDDTFIYMLAYPSREARDEMWSVLAYSNIGLVLHINKMALSSAISFIEGSLS